MAVRTSSNDELGVTPPREPVRYIAAQISSAGNDSRDAVGALGADAIELCQLGVVGDGDEKLAFLRHAARTGTRGRTMTAAVETASKSQLLIAMPPTMRTGDMMLLNRVCGSVPKTSVST